MQTDLEHYAGIAAAADRRRATIPYMVGYGPKWPNWPESGKMALVHTHGALVPSSKSASALAKLPRAPASDLKKRGWRGMMNALHRNGKLLITNHDEPQAVIMAAAEYSELMQRIEGSQARMESALEGLKHSFDDRLSSLQDTDAAARLRSIVRAPAKLRAKVKAGSSF